MSDDRPNSWDPATRAAYLAKTAEKAAASQRIKDGEATIKVLDHLLANLGRPAKQVLEALVVTGRQSFIAPHNHPDLRLLIAKCLLAYPRGQGGQWMRAAKTSYTVPSAVWEKLQSSFRQNNAPVTPSSLLRIEHAEALLRSIALGETALPGRYNERL